MWKRSNTLRFKKGCRCYVKKNIQLADGEVKK